MLEMLTKKNVVCQSDPLKVDTRYNDNAAFSFKFRLQKSYNSILIICHGSNDCNNFDGQ